VNKSANAAKNSADALIVIERAYVFVGPIRLDFNRTNGDIQPGITRAWYSFVNFGKTPAVVKEVYRDMCVESAMPPIFIHDEANSSYGEFILKYEGVSSEFPYQIPLSGEHCKAIANATKSVFFFGFIRYEDVFSEEWIRGFCFRYDFAVQGFVTYGGKAYNYHRRYKATS
jgi:hypothetical protein